MIFQFTLLTVKSLSTASKSFHYLVMIFVFRLSNWTKRGFWIILYIFDKPCMKRFLLVMGVPLGIGKHIRYRLGLSSDKLHTIRFCMRDWERRPRVQ